MKTRSKSAGAALGDGSDMRMFRKTFIRGLLAGLIITSLLVAWAELRAADTEARLEERTPTETVALKSLAAEPANDSRNSQPPAAPKENLVQGDGSVDGGALKATSSITALSPAPMDGLTQNVEGNELPAIRPADAMTPFQAYKKPFTPKEGMAPVAIVIVDYGLSDETSQSILDAMPDGVTLALSPYSRNAAQWAAAARAYGHEFWMMAPMETQDFGTDDTGPDTILQGAQPQENLSRLHRILGAAPGFAGLVSGEGHAFAKGVKAIETVMTETAGRGLGFLESNPANTAFADFLPSVKNPVPHGTNDLWIDDDMSTDGLASAFAALETRAKSQGGAIAFLHPTPAAVTALKAWTAGAEAQGLQLAPASTLMIP